MTIAATLYSHLIGDANITAIVSTRVSALIGEQNSTVPFITFDETGDDRTQTFAGQQSLTQTFIDIDAWDDGYDGCKTLQKAIITSLLTMGGSSGVCRVMATKGPDVYEYDVNLYRCNVQATIWYKDT